MVMNPTYHLHFPPSLPMVGCPEANAPAFNATSECGLVVNYIEGPSFNHFIVERFLRLSSDRKGNTHLISMVFCYGNITP